jgi:hypothetical protein
MIGASEGAATQSIGAEYLKAYYQF